MTSTVFDNAMTAHVWAQQRQPSGRSHNGNFYFEGTRIYSYGGHFIAGLALPDRVFAVNADNYSMTTSGKHMPAVRRAVSHNYLSLPDLTEIADSLEKLARGGSPDQRHGIPGYHAKAIRAYLAKHGATLRDDAGAYLYALVSRGDWQAYKAREAAKAAKAAETSRKRAARFDRAEAAKLARVPLALVIERSWRQADSYGQRTLRDQIKAWRTYHRAAGGKLIKAAVWARIKAARAILIKAESMSDRHGNARPYVALRSQIATLRRLRACDFRADGADISPWQALGNIGALETLQQACHALLRAHMPPAIRQRLTETRDGALAVIRHMEAERSAADARARARADLKRTVDSLRAYFPREGTADAEGVAWADNRAQAERRAAYWFRIASQIEAFRAAGRFPAMGAKLALLLPELQQRGEAAQTAEERAEAETRAARQAWRDMTPAWRCEAWRAGPTPFDLLPGDTRESGPLLRAVNPEVSACTVTAGELLTSEGARVPLRHAFAVFAFVRDCRAKGLPWIPGGLSTPGAKASHARHGPKHIRVGHFQIDSIAANGDFVAGCHEIKWPEIERLANRLGVFEMISEGEAV